MRFLGFGTDGMCFAGTYAAAAVLQVTIVIIGEGGTIRDNSIRVNRLKWRVFRG